MAHTDTHKPKQQGVTLQLSAAGGIDQYGDPAILRKGETRVFTEAEARELLKVTNRHGARVFQRVKG